MIKKKTFFFLLPGCVATAAAGAEGLLLLLEGKIGAILGALLLNTAAAAAAATAATALPLKPNDAGYYGFKAERERTSNNNPNYAIYSNFFTFI